MRNVLIPSVLLLAACSTRPNPDVCCRGPDDCAAANIPIDRTCANGLVCSEGHLCVPPTCTTNSECTTDRPFCSAGQCAQCDTANPCNASAPVCDLENGNCGGCNEDADCVQLPATPVCNTASGGCVECLTSASCPVDRPQCTDAHRCIGCTTHADCASNACLPDGSCGTDANVAYANPAGNDNATCAKATPCKTIGAALATNKPNIKLSGTFQLADGASRAGISIDRDLNVIAETGTRLEWIGGSGITSILEDAVGKHVLVSDVTFAAAPGLPAARGLASAGTLDVTRCRIVGNLVGVFAKDLAIRDSVVADNKFGGLDVSGSLAMVNTIVAHNGQTTGIGIGGVAARTPAGKTATIDFSTIIDNVNMAGGAPPGVACLGAVQVTGRNNILVRNPSSPNCQFNFSLFSAGGELNGTNNISGDPLFKSTTDPLSATFYRVAVGSASIDAGDPSNPVSHDIDGDARPQGSGVDMGADEFKP